MLPLVQQAGARIYEVLTLATDIDVAVPTYSQILKPLCEKYGHEMRAVLVDFLDPADADVEATCFAHSTRISSAKLAGLEPGVLEALKASQGVRTVSGCSSTQTSCSRSSSCMTTPQTRSRPDLIKLIDRARSTIKVEAFRVKCPITVTKRGGVARSDGGPIGDCPSRESCCRRAVSEFDRPGRGR